MKVYIVTATDVDGRSENVKVYSNKDRAELYVDYLRHERSKYEEHYSPHKLLEDGVPEAVWDFVIWHVAFDVVEMEVEE